jgi:hypothetical protein
MNVHLRTGKIGSSDARGRCDIFLIGIIIALGLIRLRVVLIKTGPWSSSMGTGPSRSAGEDGLVTTRGEERTGRRRRRRQSGKLGGEIIPKLAGSRLSRRSGAPIVDRRRRGSLRTGN